MKFYSHAIIHIPGKFYVWSLRICLIKLDLGCFEWLFFFPLVIAKKYLVATSVTLLFMLAGLENSSELQL